MMCTLAKHEPRPCVIGWLELQQKTAAVTAYLLEELALHALCTLAKREPWPCVLGDLWLATA